MSHVLSKFLRQPGHCVLKTRTMSTTWIVRNQYQCHEYYLDCAKITNQSHEFYLECPFCSNQSHVYYLEHLFNSTLKSIGIEIKIAILLLAGGAIQGNTNCRKNAVLNLFKCLKILAQFVNRLFTLICSQDKANNVDNESKEVVTCK